MKTLIRIEEGALLVAAYLLSLWLGFSWWLFVVLIFLPDISMVGYLMGNKTGALIYNLFHMKAIAIAFVLMGFYLENNVLALAGLILFGHSSLDRIFGFGLKFPDDFNHTHMGIIGKDTSPKLKIKK